MKKKNKLIQICTLSVVASSSLSFVVMLLSLLWYIKQVICQLLAEVFAQSI